MAGRLNARILPLIVLSSLWLMPACGPGGSATAQALDGVDSSGNVTGNVVLTRDITEADFPSGLTISGLSNVTIDGNGHSFVRSDLEVGDSEDTHTVTGITVANGSNIVIKNFTKISGFSVGIYDHGTGTVIKDCTFEGNLFDGVFLAGSSPSVQNNIFKEFNSGIRVSSTDSSLTGNQFRGGRVGIRTMGGAITTFSGNRLIHQAQSPIWENRRLFRFGDVTKTANVGGTITFSLDMLLIDDSPSPSSTYALRTVPPFPVSAAKNGARVSGSFVSDRAGLIALIAEVTDPAGNIETRMSRVLVGPTAARTVQYYWHGSHLGGGRYPRHGQGQTKGNGGDSAGMYLSPPAQAGSIFCGGWVQESPDELPSMPAALLTKVDYNRRFKLDPNGTVPAFWGMHRDVLYGSLSMPPFTVVAMWAEWQTGKIQWGSFTMNPTDTTILTYPIEWYFLATNVNGQGPVVETGVAGQLTSDVFHYSVTTSPEVASVSNQNLLVLEASAGATGGGDERITVFANGEQANLGLVGFWRPFVGVVTQINAAGDARFGSGLVNGEHTFNAVPLEVRPDRDAVSVQVGTWSSGDYEWTESAVGSPATVMHTLSGLAAQGSYRVNVNGAPLLSATADASGKLSFPYSAGFPAAFVVTNAATAGTASASFVKTDTTTQGNWNGAYGADGYNVSEDANTKTPSYAQVSLSNESHYTWAWSTTDVRALKKPENLGDRIAGTWYTSGVSSFTMDVNLTDGNSHQVALYALDWDQGGRAQTIKVLDAATSTVLDSRTLSAGSFVNGQYVVWNIKGHVKFEVVYNGGYNAVISGLFFGPGNPNDGAPPPYTLTATPASPGPGQSVTVSWTAPAGQTSATDWIGLYAQGGANTAYLAWGYTAGGLSGTMTFTAPSAPGSYEFRYLRENGYTDVAQSNLVTVVSGSSFTVSANPAAVAPGGAITATWTAPASQASPLDWIAVYASGTPNTAFLDWKYTGGTASGSLTLTAPAETGSYELRYLRNQGYTDVARSNPVTVAANSFTVQATPSSISPGSPITASWTAPPGQTTNLDWIGLYVVGAANTDFDQARWAYTNGATSGTVSFSAPGAAGTYEFRYLKNDGYTDEARSNPVSVGGTASFSAGVSSSAVLSASLAGAPPGSARDASGGPGSTEGSARGSSGGGGSCGATGLETVLIVGLRSLLRRRKR